MLSVTLVCLITAKVYADHVTTLSTGKNILMEIGKELRKFLHDLFGSKMSEHMEVELLRLRQDFEARLQEHKNTIAELRAEKHLLQSKLAIFELSMQQKSGIDPSRMAAKKPSFANFTSPPITTRWEQFQRDYEIELAKEDTDEVKAQRIAAEKLAAKEKELVTV